MAKIQSRSSWKNALVMGGGAFFIALLLSYVSQAILGKITSIILSFLLLLIIILIGIVFDVIGMATAVAGEASFHAKAAKKIPGARQSLNLLKNAERVTSFANDVVGDISGTLSGALGAVIVLRLLGQQGAEELIASTLMMAVVAAVTVGGKAWGKVLALREANEIVFLVGRILYTVERITHWFPFKFVSGKGRRK